MIVGRHRRKFFHPAQFAFSFLAHFVGQIGFGEALTQLPGFRFFATLVLTQLFLNRFHLLTQHIITLRLVHFGLRFAGNLRTQANDFNFPRQKIMREVQQIVDAVRFEHLLLFLNAETENRSQEISESHRIVRAQHHEPNFWRYLWQISERLLNQRLHVARSGASGWENERSSSGSTRTRARRCGSVCSQAIS